jgi:hypothetical protein
VKVGAFDIFCSVSLENQQDFVAATEKLHMVGEQMEVISHLEEKEERELWFRGGGGEAEAVPKPCW